MADWDRPLALRWVILMAVAFLLPDVTRWAMRTEWTWPWERLEGLEPDQIAVVLLPLLLAGVVFLLLFISSGRTRGLLVFAACTAAMLLPIELASEPRHGTGTLLLIFQFSAAEVMVMLLVFGPVFVAAGNRQAKVELTRGWASLTAGVGGLAILFCFFYPLPGESLFGVLTSGGYWEGLWGFMLWLMALFFFGLFGALSLLPVEPDSEIAEYSQTWISRLARVLPWGLPVALVLMYLIAGGDGLLHFAYGVAKELLVFYGLIILMAVGLARCMQGDGDVAPAVREH